MNSQTGPKSPTSARHSFNNFSRRVSAAALIFICAALPSGCKNAFEEASTKNTNEAYLFDAKRAIDAQNYTLALEKLLALTPDFQQRRDVISTTASAYAGRCGLNFLKLAQALTDHPDDNLFKTLTSAFRNATTGSIEDCSLAEAKMRSLGTGLDFSTLSADENVFLAIVAFSKIGAIFGTYADVDNDGLTDSTFNACRTTVLSKESVQQIGVSMNVAVAALSASGSSIAGNGLNGISGACTMLGAGFNFCSVDKPSDVTDDMVRLLGGVIGSNQQPGLGVSFENTSCTADPTIQNCVCP